MKKHQFLKSLRIIESMYKDEENFCKNIGIVLDSTNKSDNSIFSVKMIRDAYTSWIDWLKDILNDKDDLINFYIYDCVFGLNNKKFTVDGKDYIMSFKVLCELLNVED